MPDKLPLTLCALVVSTALSLLCMPFGLTPPAPPAWAQDSVKDILSPDERAWLTDHPVIRLAPERSYAPFIFEDVDGELKGMIDYISLLEQKLGGKFQLLESSSLASILGMVQNRVTVASSFRQFFSRNPATRQRYSHAGL